MYKSRKVSDPCITIMFYIAKFWGVAPFNLKNNRLSHGSWINNVYPIIFILLLLVITIFVVKSWDGVQYPGQTPWTSTIDVLSFYVGYLAILACVIRVMRNKKSIIEINELLIKIKEPTIVSGRELGYKKKLKILTLQTGFSIIMRIFFDSLSSVAVVVDLDNFLLLAMGFMHKIMLVTLHVVMIIFLGIIYFSKHYFESLNHTLSNICGSKCESITAQSRRGGQVDEKSADTRVRNVVIAGIEADFGAINDLKSIQILIQIEREYLDIRTLIEKTVTFFSPLLLLIIADYTSEVFLAIYYIYNLVYNSSVATDHKILVTKVGGALSWLLPKVSGLWIIAHVCHSVQEAANSTADTLYKMWITNRPKELKDEIKIFFLRLLQKPLHISAYGFFYFDYSYLYKMFCAVLAYFVIVLQLDSAKSNSHENSSNLTVPDSSVRP
ncbi:uncharacterized protein LOC125499774 [Athalia rosae]|uniref:uncharacterized protein LOC125499774 n=1 Tax=Athalia rosae TaxID=37344 RepID=UPI00203389D6|nr:uncharacterized protein LOC125499774 [Athalia rosae]